MTLPPIGTVLIGRFRLDRLVGQGGMGAVYEGFELALGRRVAIKLIVSGRDARNELVVRLRREALAAAALHHPNVALTTELSEGDPPFIVMEYIEGLTLAAHLEREGPFPIERAARIALQILDGLGAAHAAGVVHRDLKPANVMLTPTTAFQELVKILDFGIAKVLDEERYTRLTQTGSILGTPGYMAPEQARGGIVDARTDLYSLGVLLYKLLTGRLPYEAEDAVGLLMAVVRDAPIPLQKVRPDVPAGLPALLSRALEKDPARRFSSAAEMSAALMPFLSANTPRHSIPATVNLRPHGASIAAERPEMLIAKTRVAPPRSTSRGMFFLLASLVALLALGLGSGAAIWLARRSTGRAPVAPIASDATSLDASVLVADASRTAVTTESPIDASFAMSAVDASFAMNAIDVANDASVDVHVDDSAGLASLGAPTSRDAASPRDPTPRPPRRPRGTAAEDLPAPDPNARAWDVAHVGGGSSNLEESEPGRRLIPAIRTCLSRSAPENLVAGLLSVIARVGARGEMLSVHSQAVGADLQGTSFERCLATQLRTLRFELSGGSSDGEVSVAVRIR